ncbi:MAG: 2-phospho-L-lactate guanylyltransferase [Proteobacteria bacterium]|nr:2-phospho-L-lactate guanylyltransferase [Pseudomonadota bacterium]
MPARALLPLKDLVEAKSRLSGLLSPAERRALAQAMVEDVLSVLAAHPLISAVTLVSDDPCADMLAAKYGARHWLESSLGCRGLNRVLERSCERLCGESDQHIIVLHGDLPCLEAADITAVLDALASEKGLIVACDRHELGTNLLAFHPQNKVEFSFGSNSCALHQASAEARRVPVKLLRRPGTALDIDEPGDLALLMAEIDLGRGGQCAQLLGGTPLGNRIRTQLASLQDAAVVAVISEESKSRA